jgi:hypothetical protein
MKRKWAWTLAIVIVLALAAFGTWRLMQHSPLPLPSEVATLGARFFDSAQQKEVAVTLESQLVPAIWSLLQPASRTEEPNNGNIWGNLTITLKDGQLWSVVLFDSAGSLVYEVGSGSEARAWYRAGASRDLEKLLAQGRRNERLQLLAKDIEIVAHRVEVADRRLQDVAVFEIELPGQLVMRQTRGLDEQQSALTGADVLLGDLQELGADAAGLLGLVHKDPVEIPDPVRHGGGGEVDKSDDPAVVLERLRLMLARRGMVVVEHFAQCHELVRLEHLGALGNGEQGRRISRDGGSQHRRWFTGL